MAKHFAKSPVLKLYRKLFSCKGRIARATAKKWFLCGDELEKYFDIPKTADRIQFFAYVEDGPKRLPVRLGVDCIYVDDRFTCFIQETKKDIYKRVNGSDETTKAKPRNIYVECEYWTHEA